MTCWPRDGQCPWQQVLQPPHLHASSVLRGVASAGAVVLSTGYARNAAQVSGEYSDMVSGAAMAATTDPEVRTVLGMTGMTSKQLGDVASLSF